MSNKASKLLNEYKHLLLFILLMTVFRSAVADWSPVPTGSMQPTIIEGDVILINKLAYDIQLPLLHTSLLNLAEPQRGDIVIFDSKVSELRLVKRVIGIPGDLLEIRDKQLIINGNTIEYQVNGSNQTNRMDVTENLLGMEHLIRLNTDRSRGSNLAPTLVPDNVYFVMGDARDNSADSRVIGFVPRDEIIGRAKHVVLSLDLENNYKPRLNRFLHRL